MPEYLAHTVPAHWWSGKPARTKSWAIPSSVAVVIVILVPLVQRVEVALVFGR